MISIDPISFAFLAAGWLAAVVVIQALIRGWNRNAAQAAYNAEEDFKPLNPWPYSLGLPTLALVVYAFFMGGVMNWGSHDAPGSTDNEPGRIQFTQQDRAEPREDGRSIQDESFDSLDTFRDEFFNGKEQQ